MGKMDFKWIQKYKKIFSGMDRQKWIVCILIGVLLLVIAIPVESKEDEKAVEQQKNSSKEIQTDDQYEKKMEKRLEEIIGKMDGVGEVDVMITLEDEGESVVAQDVKRQVDEAEQSIEESTVFAGETPYETKVKTPKVRGICIVAQGAEDDKRKIKIYEAVQALFAVEAHKISIVEMGAQEGI